MPSSDVSSFLVVGAAHRCNLPALVTVRMILQSMVSYPLDGRVDLAQLGSDLPVHQPPDQQVKDHSVSMRSSALMILQYHCDGGGCICATNKG